MHPNNLYPGETILAEIDLKPVSTDGVEYDKIENALTTLYAYKYPVARNERILVLVENSTKLVKMAWYKAKDIKKVNVRRAFGARYSLSAHVNRDRYVEIYPNDGVAFSYTWENSDVVHDVIFIPTKENTSEI